MNKPTATPTNQQRSEARHLAEILRGKLEMHRLVMNGLCKEAEQSLENLLESGSWETLLTRCSQFIASMKTSEEHMRDAVESLIGKPTTPVKGYQSFDGQTLSRVGEVDIHV